MMTAPYTIHIDEEASPLQARDQNIFRPLTNTKHDFSPKTRRATVTVSSTSTSSSAWHPPLYRNTTLRSSPSQGFHSRTVSTHSYGDENQENGTSYSLPVDFIPPRHCFARPQAERDPYSLRDKDIVCGRGAPSLVHPGNQSFRELIKQHEPEYLCAKRSDKPLIAMEVLEELRRRGVRFVRRIHKRGGYIWVEVEENKAYDKVCQSLREGAPELRRKMLASEVKHSSSGQRNGMIEFRERQRQWDCISPLPCY
eukprot:Nitzschia sp. Nitz4//scaffold13_size275219//172280//173041//NITZ4_000890-RA/size275219-processed-gene-0.98-mRNA-1//1//CDS//3329536062//5540//frame0